METKIDRGRKHLIGEGSTVIGMGIKNGRDRDQNRWGGEHN